MSKSVILLLEELKLAAYHFDSDSSLKKIQLLQKLQKAPLPGNSFLVKLADVLLFINAHADNREILVAAEKILGRIAALLIKEGRNPVFDKSGLPYTIITSTYSHDCLRWFLKHPHCKLTFEHFQNEKKLNDTLIHTLPRLTRSETTIGYSNEELLLALGVKKSSYLSFIVDELQKFDSNPTVKDQLFEQFGLYFKIVPHNKSFSKFYNKINFDDYCFQSEIIKKFDSSALLNKPVTKPRTLTEKNKEQLILVIKNSLALLDRETDPVTYLDPASLQYYKLDKGISIALFTATPDRQLPLESYVGYTLFKNGFPAAYGGAWVFGPYALFGINIFESFRGAESGYMLCQLLRIYRQVFQVNYFEVEAYQYGLDNPEGISSGAFWFYYRYGFRPFDKKLMRLAADERKKIEQKPGYRTSQKILERFTESSIVLNIDSIKQPTTVADISSAINKMVARQFGNSNEEAIRKSKSWFISQTGFKPSGVESEKTVFEDVALWAAAMNIRDKGQLEILVQMIKTKPYDLYGYQQLLLKLFLLMK